MTGLYSALRFFGASCSFIAHAVGLKRFMAYSGCVRLLPKRVARALIAMLDNLRNLGLLLESNLKRRSNKQDKKLPELITELFSKEAWEKGFEANKDLKNYDGVKDFQEKLEKIEKLNASSKPSVDFLTNSFLTIALIRNFTAHYLVEQLDILKDPKKYDRIFSREVFAILFSLNYPVK